MRPHSIQHYVVALIIPYVFVTAAHAGGPSGTAFTYQGQLKQDGAPVNDTCDFEFSLWDDPVVTLVGNQVGPTLIFDGGPGHSPPISGSSTDCSP